MGPELLERVLRDLLSVDQMLVVLDSSGAVGEMHSDGTVDSLFGEGWATIESKDWHLHMDMKSVAGVQFVEADDHGGSIPKLYYVRLSDVDDGTVIRFYFPSPWLDADENPTEFQPDRLKLFEEFRDRYVWEGGIVFARRAPAGT